MMSWTRSAPEAPLGHPSTAQPVGDVVPEGPAAAAGCNAGGDVLL